MKLKAKLNSPEVKKWLKVSLGMMLCLTMMVCTGVVGFAEGTTPVSYSDFSSVFTALQEQISVGTVVGVIAAVVGACIGLVFMWWGVRKVVRMLMAAFRKGKISV